jgi:tetraprenyl-beta-curcumene synthase
MTESTSARRALAICFLTAAPRYWLSVFPSIRRETRCWRERAEAIPDPHLREAALEAQRVKRGNVEGSAAFASFVPSAWRGAVVRTQVAFQSIYDYVDTLSEQPSNDPVGNARQLHQALLVALDNDAPHIDYYQCHPHKADAGYLREIIDTCRGALYALPSHAAITTPLRRCAERIVGYQSLNLTVPQGGHRQLKHWANQIAPPGAELRWWETAASCGSSLGLFALIAAAAKPALSCSEASTIEEAYWPWIGALHSLLDSLIDQEEDATAEHRNLLSYYTTPSETASRFQTLATEAKRAAATVPKAHEHTLILAAMASHYLTAPQALTPLGRQTSKVTTQALGNITVLTTHVLAIRRRASQLSIRGIRSPESIAPLLARIARQRSGIRSALNWRVPLPTDPP